MAVSETIQEILEGIDDAQYGRDMRDYIHKGIQKCYEEGSAGETDLTARSDIADILENFGTVESSTTASKAYAEGELFILNNTLYKATSAISQGGTITVGTNAEITSLQNAVINQPNYTNVSLLDGWNYNQSPQTITISTTGWYLFVVTNIGTGRLYLEITNESLATLFCTTVASATDSKASSTWMYLKAGEKIKVAFASTGGTCKMYGATSR